ncbi:heavy metal translocating P-type ATPase [Lactococcus fujiensis]|uniref:Cd(2+)-exporting ATPase n=1 Tax=Lactococcus fujiensis JCM 16395 TaxID=1291764 RepID=A0A2A5RLN6_9LACT|nr:heavy metal translocating P-type ATPase [Lactococcus fujiensis]PCS00212.1 cobalt ABC transporter ATP-binding protein [Lactococcus fujiensis JCM 16395]
MKNWQKLILVFLIASSALIAYFGLGQEFIAQLIVTVAGGFLAITMFIEMIKTLRSGSYGVDLLAITAIITTLLVGEYWASLIIVLMLVGGETLEDYAAGRAHRELSALLQKSPEIAHVKTGETLVDHALDEVKIGSVLLIKPMEVIPIDGILKSDAAILDESSVTGETKPNELIKGNEVMSGAINGSSSIEIETTVLASESQFQKIINLVREAEKTPANFVRLADRYAVPFTIIAYIIAGIAYAISGDPVRIAEVLVVASPCPLILAAPIAFVSGMSRSSKNGFLIKNGTVIEKLATAKSIFFDKTGTITDGKIQVASIEPVSELTEVELLEIAYTLEKSSGHVLAKAISKYAQERNIPTLGMSGLIEVAGMGVTGQIGGHEIKIGRKNFVGAPVDLDYETAFYVSRDGKYIGAVTFSDKIRPEAKSVMDQLKSLGLNNLTMLTGDNDRVAQKVAAEVDIPNVYASLLPGEKLEYIKTATEHPVIMVGDGVNDAPALTLADVGISVGSGNSTVASEAADIVLLKNDLSSVTKAVTISRDTMRIAKQAVLMGIIICIILMLIAATGIIPAIIGALFQEVIDVVSILYALRALRD